MPRCAGNSLISDRLTEFDEEVGREREGEGGRGREREGEGGRGRGEGGRGREREGEGGRGRGVAVLLQPSDCLPLRFPQFFPQTISENPLSRPGPVRELGR